jgi:hypothetical protein
MIELPIYHHDDQSKELDQLGIATPLDEVETKQMLFFTINAIGHYKDSYVECSLVHSNGMSFVCPYPYEKLKSIFYEGRT